MKKIFFIILLILVLFLLTSCASIVDTMGDNFKTIEGSQNGNTVLCYDKNTNAVYIVYKGSYKYGISPYIVFDDSGRATVGKWDGEKIIAETIKNK